MKAAERSAQVKKETQEHLNKFSITWAAQLALNGRLAPVTAFQRLQRWFKRGVIPHRTALYSAGRKFFVFSMKPLTAEQKKTFPAKLWEYSVKNKEAIRSNARVFFKYGPRKRKLKKVKVSKRTVLRVVEKPPKFTNLLDCYNAAYKIMCKLMPAKAS